MMKIGFQIGTLICFLILLNLYGDCEGFAGFTGHKNRKGKRILRKVLKI
jgi:hypothetical protein